MINFLLGAIIGANIGAVGALCIFCLCAINRDEEHDITINSDDDWRNHE